MAVGNTTNWAKNTAFDQVVDAIYATTVYRNGDFLGLFPVRQSEGGTSYEWRVNSAAASGLRTPTAPTAIRRRRS